MSKFKKNLTINITLICVLAFSAIHLTMLILNLFNAFNFELPNNFSYITAFILMILCLALYIIGFYVETKKTLKIPTWFKMVFYVAFFIFTNVYYILGLFQNLIFNLIFVAYLAFVLSVISLSIYYNTNKDEKNVLKATTKQLTFGVINISISLTSLVLFLIEVFKVIFFANAALSTLLTFVFEMFATLIVIATTSTIFALSHKKSKILINKCLIKTIPKPVYRSVKNID